MIIDPSLNQPGRGSRSKFERRKRGGRTGSQKGRNCWPSQEGGPRREGLYHCGIGREEQGDSMQEIAIITTFVNRKGGKGDRLTLKTERQERWGSLLGRGNTLGKGSRRPSKGRGKKNEFPA